MSLDRACPHMHADEPGDGADDVQTATAWSSGKLQAGCGYPGIGSAKGAMTSAKLGR